MADHYQVLGLSKSASKQEIKEAFRRLAVKFHPDKHCQSSNPAKEEATRRFKQVSEAYEVLIDDRKRAAYNLKYRAGGAAASAGFRSNNTYYNYYSQSYYKPHYRASSSSTSFNVNSWVFRLDWAFRYLTSRSFLLNLTFAGILLGSAAVIDMSRETLWNMHNPGKSFEEAMEAIKKNKTQNAEKR